MFYLTGSRVFALRRFICCGGCRPVGSGVSQAETDSQAFVQGRERCFGCVKLGRSSGIGDQSVQRAAEAGAVFEVLADGGVGVPFLERGGTAAQDLGYPWHVAEERLSAGCTVLGQHAAGQDLGSLKDAGLRDEPVLEDFDQRHGQGFRAGQDAGEALRAA